MLDDVRLYLPQDRRHALASGRGLSDRADGAALFADVSGFTPLAETLARTLGPQRGAEELTALLNRIYTVLIAEVDRFGGSVVTFGGDAVTCWFGAIDDRQPTTDGRKLGDVDHSPAALRAVACALAMQRAMHPFASVALPGGLQAALAVKVTVASGPARRFILGDPQIQVVEVLAGRTVDRLAAAAALASAGEVLVDEPTAAALGGALRIARWAHGQAPEPRAAVISGLGVAVAPAPWPPLPPDALPDERVRPWLHTEIYTRLNRQLEPFLAELRPAVALMSQFGGLDYDGDDQAGPLLDAYLRQVQWLAGRYGGILVDITLADKGGYLYVAFGAPVAHEDDSRRAVLTALDLRSLAVVPGGPPPRIGITRGTMRTGAYGGQSRRTYGVLGDDVNLACRLMDLAAPGQLLVSERVRRTAGAGLPWATVPAVTPKGKRDPVPVFSLRPGGLDAAPAGGAEPGAPALSGRRAERAALDEFVAALAVGRGGILVVEGEPGIGKSRLLAELAGLLPAGVARIEAFGRSIERQTPYRAWTEALAALLDIGPLDAPHAWAPRVVATLGADPEFAERLPLLNDILDLGLPETPLTRSLDAALRGESLADLVVALVRRRAANGPLALVIDDAHWLDSRSWSLVVRTARALASERLPLLLALGLRPLEGQTVGQRHLLELLRLEGCRRLALQELERDALVELVASRLSVPPEAVPPALAELVLERAGGNPLFAEELVATLMDEGSVRVEADPAGVRRCAVRPDLRRAARVLPDTLQGVLLARIDRLPPEQQLTLKVAAVIGQTFAYPPLHSTHARHAATDGAQLKEELRSLAAQRYTWLEEPEPNLAYSFKHILVQEAAYQTLLYAQRRELHMAVARWYEQRADAAGSYPLLAHHYRGAEDRERERHYARLAGVHAADQYANEEAVAYFSRALELTLESERQARFELLLARQQIFDLQARRDAQAADLDALEALAAELADPLRRATVALWRARYATSRGDFLAGAAESGRAIDLAREAGALELEATGYLKRGEALARRSEYGEAEETLQRALELARSAGLPQVEADALRALGLLAWYRSSYERAVEYAERSLPIYRAIGDRRGEAESLANLGNIAREHADFERAHGYYMQTMALCRAIGDRTREGWALYHLGTAAAGRGDFEAALSFYQRSLPAFQLSGNSEGEGWALGNLGKVAFTQGRYAEARELHGRSLAIFRAIGQRGGQGWALNSLGNVALAQADYPAAREYYAEALALSHAAGSRRDEADILVNLGHIALYTGAYDEAQAHYAESLEISRGLGKRSGEAFALDGLGSVALARGDVAAARGLHEASLAIARDAGFAPSQGWSRAGLGACAAAEENHAAARARYAEALALFEAADNRRGVALALLGMADAHRARGDLGAAREAAARALVLARSLGARRVEAFAQCGLGAALLAEGDRAGAARAYRAALELRRALGEHHLAEEALAGLRLATPPGC